MVHSGPVTNSNKTGGSYDSILPRLSDILWEVLAPELSTLGWTMPGCKQYCHPRKITAHPGRACGRCCPKRNLREACRKRVSGFQGQTKTLGACADRLTGIAHLLCIQTSCNGLPSSCKYIACPGHPTVDNTAQAIDGPEVRDVSEGFFTESRAANACHLKVRFTRFSGISRYSFATIVSMVTMPDVRCRLLTPPCRAAGITFD